MAIKIIKHGKKPVMKKTCPVCECEFEFELSDLETDYTICLNSYPSQYRRYVTCPECGEKIYYDTITVPNYPNTPVPWYPNTPTEPWYPNNWPWITWTSTKIADPCKDCPNKEGLKDVLGNPVAGDSPCDWCQKNPWKPNCTGKSFTYTTNTLADTPDFKFTTEQKLEK